MHILIAALHRPSKPTGVCRHAANLAQCLADTKEVTKVTLIVGAWQRHYFETFISSKIWLQTRNNWDTSCLQHRE